MDALIPAVLRFQAIRTDVGHSSSEPERRRRAGTTGVMYFAPYWCTVHGIDQALEAIRRGDTLLQGSVGWRRDLAEVGGHPPP